ncbi:MAG TPA: L,D-transpeptidase [Candidatus Saccharimonadales bacterium]|nr:L,D-transpeptidase [Candidatus Saccharimonadales bacterium]
MKLPPKLLGSVGLAFGLALTACASGNSTPVAASPTPIVTVSSTSAAPTPSEQPGQLLKHGSRVAAVRTLQRLLYQQAAQAYYKPTACNFDTDFGPLTKRALQTWQHAKGHKPSGRIRVNSAQWRQLQETATADRLAYGLDAKSVAAAKHDSTHWAIDASQAPACVRVLHYLPAQNTVKTVFSSQAAYAGWAYNTEGQLEHYHTPNGVFHLEYKDPAGINAYSSTYDHAPMPWASCFIGSSVCFHQDGLFPSHGCVHIPSMADASLIYHRVPLGTIVRVHA